MKKLFVLSEAKIHHHNHKSPLFWIRKIKPATSEAKNAR
jgi:hypothetical protein